MLWVVTTDNLLRIDPSLIPHAGSAPQAYFEKISLLDETMKSVPPVTSTVLNGYLDLSFTEHNLRFDFTAPVFRGPTFVRFRYQLEGQDETWSQPTRERYAVYTNLAPGKYIFKVIACNDAELWSAAPACFEIVIHPAFWQTWWFRVIIPLVIAVFFFRMGFQCMSRRKKSMQQKLK